MSDKQRKVWRIIFILFLWYMPVVDGEVFGINEGVGELNGNYKERG